jgi:hypothetical protein
MPALSIVTWEPAIVRGGGIAIPDRSSSANGTSFGPSGGVGSDAVASGLDQSAEAGAAGRSTGAAFADGLLSELRAAEAEAMAAAERIKAALSFTARPLISPRVEGFGQSLRAIHADTGVGA